MSRSTAVAVVATPFQIASTRNRPLVHLRDLDIAPENLRFGEPPDDDIPLLAETLFAAGQLQPLTVRPGRKKEAAHMALDGRRRLLALRLLVEQGRIDDGFLVEVFVETDPPRQAAAALLTNTAVPVHVADIIAAIGRMLQGKLGVPTIAKALGYAEIDVKRLAALSALPDVALLALRLGRLNLRQARLLARLTDSDEQAELARMTLDGHGFQDWRVTEQLDEARVTARDPRCALIGPERYAQAGGRTETDLFGELPPVLLDPAILTEVWTRRAREIAMTFEAEGLAVHVTAGPEPDLPDDLEAAGYVYGGRLPVTEMAAYRDKRDAFNATVEGVEAVLTETTDAEAVDAALDVMIRARLAMDQAGWSGRVATTLVLRPAARTGIEVRCFTPVEPEVEDETDDQAPASTASAAAAPVYRPPEVDTPAPETEGINHALHAARTDVATRGLIRALADDPGVAFTALIARLFNQLTVRTFGQRSESALALTASAFKPTGGRVIDVLDGEVRQRLDDRRAAWEASGKTVIAWVHGLAHGDKMGLLAELTALTLDIREERTTLIRKSARAEAAELAALCGADISLTEDDIAIWDAWADAFQLIHANLGEALKASGFNDAEGKAKSGLAASAVHSAFEGAKLRFFGHLLAGLKAPTLAASIQADLAEERSAVVQIVSTNEAVMERRLASIPPEEWNNLSIDLTPREYVLDYLREAFPVNLMEAIGGEDGAVTLVPVMVDGRPAVSQDALRRREDLIERMALLPAVPGVLDALLDAFGTDAVAEITGRSRRVVMRDGRRLVERRGAAAARSETDAFMSGRKRILVFSDAGGTGRSYHADLSAPNQQRRSHYLVEPGFRSD